MRSDELRNYPAENVRQGAIVLKHPWQKLLFVAGLAVSILALITLLLPAGH